jgi:hypothetical protein
MAQAPDPFAPWRGCDPAALQAVFELETFDAQCFALLDLAPNKISARDLSLLPWDEAHEPREFRNVRDQWAGARAAKREHERERDELPLDQAVRQQFEDAVRTRDLKSADEALDLLVKLGTAKGIARQAKEQDDYSRLSARQVLVLGALVHQLRSEPLTQAEQDLLAYIDLIDSSAEQDSATIVAGQSQ